MDREAQERMRSLLRSTLEDERLSKEESQALGEALAGVGADASALAFVRNAAFALARERIEAQPGAVLGWLDRVDRQVDRAVRAAGDVRAEERVAFSPGLACLRLVTGALRSARRTVDACVFTITDDRIADLLLELHARGVRVRVVTDDEKASDPGSDVARLAAAGVGVRTDDSPDHMHHKFAVVDERVVVHGSYNWTRSAADNQEHLCLTTSRAVVEPFARRFEELWSLYGGAGGARVSR